MESLALYYCILFLARISPYNKERARGPPALGTRDTRSGFCLLHVVV